MSVRLVVLVICVRAMCVCAGVDEWMFKHALGIPTLLSPKRAQQERVRVRAHCVFSLSSVDEWMLKHVHCFFSPLFADNQQSAIAVPFVRCSIRVGIPRLLVIRARGVSECSVDAAQQLATHTHGHHFLLTAGATGTSDACGRWAS